MMKYKDEKSLFDPITKRKTEFIFGRIKNNNKPTNERIDYEDYTQKVLLTNLKMDIGLIICLYMDFIS